jgi:hypothetical protein
MNLTTGHHHPSLHTLSVNSWPLCPVQWPAFSSWLDLRLGREKRLYSNETLGPDQIWAVSRTPVSQ